MKRFFWAAIVLGLLFGVVGLQEFYLGNLIRGIFAVLFFWTGIPALIAFIQICTFLYKGEEWFNSKYSIKRTTTLNALND